MKLKSRIFRAFFILTAGLVAIAATSCSKASTEENVAAAQNAIANGDYQSAIRTIDTFDADSDDASVSTLINMAVICMEVNEQYPEQGYDAAGLLYFQRAREISADSVDLYLQSADITKTHFLATLIGLQRAMEMDGDFPEEDEHAHQQDYHDIEEPAE